MSVERKPCKKGHDVTLYNRADGRCGTCHLERNQRYRKTDKGIAKDTRYESKRRGTRTEYFQVHNTKPQRWYNNIKNRLLRTIQSKRQRISVLEREL